MKNLILISLIIFTVLIVSSLVRIELLIQAHYLNEAKVYDIILEEIREEKSKTIIARTTCYLATNNKMANGKYPSSGYVATSDRTIPFGTKVIIDKVEYEVGDRTNKRFQDFTLPTFDIFWEGSEESCLEYGVQIKNVIIK